jgi:uncharacterized protein involved in response to NO
MFKNWYERFSAQPHQPFFAHAMILFIVLMLILLGVYSHVIALDVSILTYHAYALIYMVFIEFFLGFLFVVFPRFLIQANIAPKVYMRFFMLYFIASLIFVVAILLKSPLYMLAMTILLLAQIVTFNALYTIYKKSITKDKYDTKWILIALLTGIVSHLFFLLSLIDSQYAHFLKQFSINAGFYLFLFMVIFAVSQRMIPFFTSIKLAGYTINKSKYLMEKVYGLLLLKLFLLTLGNPSLYIFADLPLLILFVYELFKWKLPVFKTSAIMWVLFIALYWIPFAFLMGVLESLNAWFSWGIVFEKASLHLLALGYFTTVLLGFGTRVVLGHSGQTPHAGVFAIVLFIAAQIIVLVRLFASFSISLNMDYVFWINHTALLLILALFAWSCKYLMILLKGHQPSH